jgi:hypothetical protein
MNLIHLVIIANFKLEITCIKKVKAEMTRGDYSK